MAAALWDGLCDRAVAFSLFASSSWSCLFLRSPPAAFPCIFWPSQGLMPTQAGHWFKGERDGRLAEVNRDMSCDGHSAALPCPARKAVVTGMLGREERLLGSWE